MGAYYVIYEPLEEILKRQADYMQTREALGTGFKNPYYYPKVWKCYNTETAIRLWHKFQNKEFSDGQIELWYNGRSIYMKKIEYFELAKLLNFLTTGELTEME